MTADTARERRQARRASPGLFFCRGSLVEV
jgi:hypothetical protein